MQVSKGLMGRIKEEVMTEKVKKTILNKLHSLIAEKGYIAGRAVDDFKFRHWLSESVPVEAYEKFC